MIPPPPPVRWRFFKILGLKYHCALSTLQADCFCELSMNLENDFATRHIGPRENDVIEMLKTLGLSSLDELLDKAVPATIRTGNISLPPPKSEHGALAHLTALAGLNKPYTSMIGMGYYGTIMPEVIKRNVLENPGYYTPYTPYQSEVSQGRLELLLAFQQMVIDLTGMEYANASLLDEATAAAEAMSMAHRLVKGARNMFYVDPDCHPQTIAVVTTRAKALGIGVLVGPPSFEFFPSRIFGALVQYPASSGEVRDFSTLAEETHKHGAFLVVATDLLALNLLKPPGEFGADIVVGSSQRFGVPMGYGGPHAAFLATRDEYKRQMPGRLIGVSRDARDRAALRMVLQVREQHIRREKATSNICTAQSLPAILAALYAIYHGHERLKLIASRVHNLAAFSAEGLRSLGYTVFTKCFFDTLTVSVSTSEKAEMILARARDAGINLRTGKHRLGISFDETTTLEDIRALLAAFDLRGKTVSDIDAIDGFTNSVIPQKLKRKSPYLMAPIFSAYHSETELMRYLRRLAAKDIALDRSMIALGSCTMKLNAASEMAPITWPNFANMHPFCPVEQAEGYRLLLSALEAQLCAITGLDAFSFQPNAGSQGEFAGLLVIRKYHQSRGKKKRSVCLIPASAHGTNPASATMAGLRVVIIPCDKNGNVDVEDLRIKAEQYRESLACLMITYPSTHGVFEENIVAICDIIHNHGGQVYMDGANMNALVGICQIAKIGVDVCHINLHKTFSIPHGGGGPGMGPIGVKKHLAHLLPKNPQFVDGDPASVGAVSATPYGSASILLISWSYIAMMGAEGMKRATNVAILNANYIAVRLGRHYPVLYTGQNGLVAHECIIDLRHVEKQSGITVEDVAKRLIDYGFHAPTISFPVHGTMMIEPTESENRKEIDCFCDAMIAIREEIAEVESGLADKQNNLLKNAPHTHDLLIAEKWELPYSKKRALFPLPFMESDKYWPPVARVDNVYGDRNLKCTCP